MLRTRKILIANLEVKIADKRLGFTSRSDLARRAGIHPSFLSKLWDPKINTVPGFQTLERLAKACNCEPYELLVDRDELLRKSLR